MRTDLVEDAVRMAITLRDELPAKVVFHTDRDLHGQELHPAVPPARDPPVDEPSRVCFDNTVAEAFSSSLEREVLSRHEFKNTGQAQAVLL